MLSSLEKKEFLEDADQLKPENINDNQDNESKKKKKKKKKKNKNKKNNPQLQEQVNE